MPTSSILFKSFHDKGWIFSKIIGVVVSGWIMWFLSYIKLLSNRVENCYIIIAILAVINLIIAEKFKDRIKIDKENISNMLTTETIFFVLLLIWVYIRGFTPQIDWSTEKFMDYGYMNATMNAEYMPAEDIWFSGYKINYYYFGQYISGYISKISGTAVGEGYNLMVSTIAALTFVMPYIIGYNLAGSIIDKEKKQLRKLIQKIVAVLAGLSICIGGTLYYPIYGVIAKGDNDYFYWEATRYIGYRPETEDKTITEIPSYSSVVADLHAHFIGTIFVLTILAILLQVLLEDKEKRGFFNIQILFLGILLGIEKMTNYWDLPIYLVIISAIIIIDALKKYEVNLKNFGISLLQIIEIVLIEEAITLPFTMDLYIGTSKIFFTGVMSPLYKLAVLWGFPTLVIGIYLIGVIIKFFKGKQKKKFFASLWEYIKNLTPSQLYIIILGICAIGLVLVPEIVYLKDIYGEEFKRTNTMFKLTYQAYILFSLAVSYILIENMRNGKKVKRIFSGICIAVLISTFGYGLDAIEYRIGGLTNWSGRLGITHSEDYIKEQLPDDAKAIDWIRQNISRDKVIVESADGSFSSSARMSVFTGNPILLGWHGHEWLWRTQKNYELPEEEEKRWKYIYSIYLGNDEEICKQIIDKYNISYIYVGNVEMEKYENINVEFLKSLGEVVYEIPEEQCEKNPVYLIKVD